MKLITKMAIAGALTLASLNANAAGVCGAGKITHINEGGWGGNDFLIKIDYSMTAQHTGMGTFNDGYLRFLASLDDTRLSGIKALAYMAFSSGRTVVVYSSGTSCAFADDITIIAPGAT